MNTDPSRLPLYMKNLGINKYNNYFKYQILGAILHLVYKFEQQVGYLLCCYLLFTSTKISKLTRPS